MTNAPARESLPRLVWAAMSDGFPFVRIVFAVLILVPVVALWFQRDQPLSVMALGFRMPMFWLGWSLVISPNVRENLRRRSTSVLGLTSPIDRAGPSSQDPGKIAVAQPILTGLGTACLGFALGLSVIAVLSDDGALHESRTTRALWCLLPIGMLVGAAVESTKTTRRLFVWSQEVAVSAATAEADADRARITALQAQMNPHFLFNALNTVASLLGSDGERARRTVQNLSGMLTHTLERSAQPLTTVADELQFVRDYLAIERERFGARLQVTYDIDPDTTAMTIPTMSLQPLVENAIKHAVTSRIEGGHIQIAVCRRAKPPGLRLSVEDDGPGFVPGSADGTGLGNLRARLRSLYGPQPAAELVTETLPTGARVSLTIPTPS